MLFHSEEKCDLSIIMPCLNEDKTVGACVDEAFKYISKHKLNGEIIVVDNGSTDDSFFVAKKHGAKVVREPVKGYGRAIRTGISNCSGKVIIIGDCDTTYDFLDLDSFYYPLINDEYDFMIGNRFNKNMEKGAMPISHKLGVPFLSSCGRMKYKVSVNDFHSGLRAVTRQAASQMEFNTDGMEFATEMVAVAASLGCRIGQVDITLRKCEYDRKSKLRTIRDGFRHLIYILKGN